MGEAAPIEEAPLSLDGLNLEVLSEAFSWLSPRAIARCALVCQSWRDVVLPAAATRAARLGLSAGSPRALLELEQREAWRCASREVTSYDTDTGMQGLAVLRDGSGTIVSKSFGGNRRSVGLYPAAGEAARGLAGHTADIQAVAADVQEGSGRIVSGDVNGEMRVWDARTGEELAVLQHGGLVFAVALDGDTVASGGDDRCARLYSLNRQLHTATCECGGAVEGLAICGGLIATADGAGKTAA
eukprot:5793267-Prymnesium_polylepis.1